MRTDVTLLGSLDETFRNLDPQGAFEARLAENPFQRLRAIATAFFAQDLATQ